ncbi:MAG TPA: NADPH-dependent FMN reductase [Chitinophagaceae bacterium]|jgi:NAD(P)H-dependent FMN reductase|nr:NADPH-dependent FMN reductase [Chitinophagaceae bacterium]
MKRRINILGISGSLRSNSSASAILNTVAGLVPERVEFTIYSGLADIPAFNDSNEIPGTVAAFIKLLSEADGVFFVIPEYAFGVPGALKNALDWTVSSSTAFPDKPVALITAATGGDKAHAAFLLTLKAMSSKIPEGATLLLSFIRSKLNERNEVKDRATLDSIRAVINSLIDSIQI